jgi:hypothetical protein
LERRESCSTERMHINLCVYKINVQSAGAQCKVKCIRRVAHTHTTHTLAHTASRRQSLSIYQSISSRFKRASQLHQARAECSTHTGGYNIIVTSAGELVSPTILSLSLFLRAVLRTLCLCIHLHRAIKFLPQHKSGSALCAHSFILRARNVADVFSRRGAY